jgi:hypothetical protein
MGNTPDPTWTVSVTAPPDPPWWNVSMTVVELIQAPTAEAAIEELRRRAWAVGFIEHPDPPANAFRSDVTDKGEPVDPA